MKAGRHDTVTDQSRALFLLGPVSLSAGDTEVRLHSVKAAALLGWLACDPGRVHARERLGALLWPDAGDAARRQSLRQAIYSVRRALGPAHAALRQTLDAVSLSTNERLSVDWWDVRSALLEGTATSALHAAALRAARGGWLDNLNMADAHDDLLDWLEITRAQVHRIRRELLETAARRLLLEMRLRDAQAIAEQAANLDPDREEPYALLMRTAAELGDRNAVALYYGTIERYLHENLGAAPSRDLRALRARLLGTNVETPYVGEASRPFALRALVDRAHEQAQIDQFVTSAQSCSSVAVLSISGMTGLGKTRLVEEVLAVAGGCSLRSIALTCRASESHAPYSLWLDFVDELSTPACRPWLHGIGESALRDLSLLTPAIADIAATGPPDVSQQVPITSAITRALAHIVRDVPLLLVLDDVQWADAASLALLSRMLRRLRHRPFIVVVAGGRDDHWRRMIADACVPVDELPLRPLSDESVVHALAGAASWLPTNVRQAAARMIDGNPMMLTEVLRYLDDERPTLSAIERLLAGGVPERVRALVTPRLRTLEPDTGLVLETTALLDQRIDVEAISRIAGLPAVAVVTALRTLENADWLERSRTDGGLRIRHEFVRRSIRDGLPSEVREALHRRAGAWFAGQARRGVSTALGAAAYHLREAGDPHAHRWFRRAARHAASIDALIDAEALLQETLALLETNDQTPPELLAEVLLELFDLEERRSHPHGMRQAIDRLTPVLRGRLSPLTCAAIELRRAALLASNGESALADVAGCKALQMFRAVGDAHGEAEALRELGFAHWRAGDAGAALAYARQSLANHRSRGDLRGEGTALINLSEICRALGSPSEAIDLARRAADLLWALQDAGGRGLAMYALASAQSQADDRTASSDSFERAKACFVAAGQPLMASRCIHACGVMAWQQGDHAKARDHIDAALVLSRQTGYVPGVAHGLLALLQLDRLDGRQVAADAMHECELWMDMLGDPLGKESLMELVAGAHHPRPLFSTVRSYIVAEEGKVYCAFESPLARAART